MRLRVLALWMIGCGCASVIAQTKVDLRTQTKSVDFSNASFTKPVRSAGALPAGCSAGELFYLSTANPGYNLYYCTTANVWTPAGASAPNYSQAFTAQTTVSLTHNLGTANVMVECFDASNVQVQYANYTIADLNSITVTFFAPQSGRCVVNGFGGPSVVRFASVFTAQTSILVT